MGSVSFPTRVRFLDDQRRSSVAGGVMAIDKARSRAVDSPMICSRTRCELTVVVILAVLTIFLFPSVQGPYSVVRGPATAFRAARSAAIAHASIVQGAMRSIRNSPGSPRLVFARLTSRKRDRTQKQCRNVVRLSAVNSQRVAVPSGPSTVRAIGQFPCT